MASLAVLVIREAPIHLSLSGVRILKLVAIKHVYHETTCIEFFAMDDSCLMRSKVRAILAQHGRIISIEEMETSGPGKFLSVCSSLWGWSPSD